MPTFFPSRLPAVLAFCLAATLLTVAASAIGASDLVDVGPGANGYIGSLDPDPDAEAGAEAGETTSPTVLLLKMLGALALVLGLILLAGYLLKRYGGASGISSDRSDSIRVVATKMLGARRSLMLVRVRGQTLLLGLTPQSINCLTEIHEVEGEWAQPATTEGAAATSFDQHLGRFVNQTIGPPNAPSATPASEE
jgi:flagellar protein FliO/FliZ